MYQRVINEDWDFRTANTKEFTHGYHGYPAMMIPQVARQLIKEYSTKKTGLIFDPYCGSGTTLVEAKLAGINSCGTDINPLAALISKTKVENYDLIEIERIKTRFEQHLSRFTLKSKFIRIPEITNIDFWFKNEIVTQLGYIDWFIENEIDEKFTNFFRIPFSETIRESSYTRNNEFKLYRISANDLNSFNVNPFDLFIKKIERNIKGLEDFNKKVKNKEAKSDVYDFNSCLQIPEQFIAPNSVDLVVTSPPYGDSRTTVAYGQFSALSNQWLGVNEARKVDSNLMGGTIKNKVVINIKSAQDQLDKIKSIDPKRFLEVNAFLFDYYQSISNVAKVIKENGRICYVVGNRTVKKINIPLDYITVDFFKEFGFELENITVRNIPNKKMPKQNSPTNKPGEIVSTMNHEFIVIMKKVIC